MPRGALRLPPPPRPLLRPRPPPRPPRLAWLRCCGGGGGGPAPLLAPAPLRSRGGADRPPLRLPPPVLVLPLPLAPLSLVPLLRDDDMERLLPPRPPRPALLLLLTALLVPPRPPSPSLPLVVVILRAGEALLCFALFIRSFLQNRIRFEMTSCPSWTRRRDGAVDGGQHKKARKNLPTCRRNPTCTCT